MLHSTRRAGRRALLCSTGLLALGLASLPSTAQAQACPSVTLADPQGLESAFPGQFERAEFEAAAGCTLTFQENPEIAALNDRIGGNAALPGVAERLPAEPLVIAPFEAIGNYGGVLNGLSNATEAGTSDLLSVRHVNLVRYSDDLQTVVPNIARDWRWNDDYTELTITLRAGHRWSDGAPFTAHDIVFWYEDLILNDEIYPETPSRWLFEGEPMGIEAVDDATVVMRFPVPAPGIVNRFAIDYGQPFQPRHFLAPMHIDHNPDADAEAVAAGYEGWADRVNNFYGGSDWKDVPSPLIDGSETVVVPTLESHILIEETATGRHLVANPYFHMVDTAGNQLPYINEIDEQYVPDAEVRNLMITNGEVDYKTQAIFIENFPLYKENEANGNYTVHLAPGLGDNVFYSFNVNHQDPEMRRIFEDLRFRRAMSLAIDRDEINEVIWLGQGAAQQATPAEPLTVAFVTEGHLATDAAFDPDAANALLDEMGLVDADGDGVRDRLDGSPLVIRLLFATQGSPGRMHELVSGYWADVGVRVDLREVTSDEYRANANNNRHDITAWQNDNISGPTISQDAKAFVPPFGDFFNPGTGYEWSAWIRTDGAEGTEPPAVVGELHDLAQQFLQVPIGSDDSNAIGGQIVDRHLGEMWKIGTVGNIQAPVIQHNDLHNFQPFRARTYDFYWSYPYRPFQWYLAEN